MNPDPKKPSRTKRKAPKNLEAARLPAGSPFRNEEEYLTFINVAAFGLAVVDPATLSFLRVNPKMGQILGHSEDELLGMDLLQVIHPVDRERYARDLQSLVREEIQELSTDRRCLRKDGKDIWTHMTATCPRYGENRSRLIVTAVLDIDERKRTENALRENELRFATLVDASFEGIALTEEGRIIDANPQLARMLGYELDELIEKDLWNFVAPVDRERVKKRILSGTEVTGDYVTAHRDGTPFMIEANARVITYKGRSIQVTAIRDISERKRMEEQLKEALEQLRQMKDRVEAENIYLREEVKQAYHEELVGESAAMKSVLAQAKRVARTDSTVLILGGTGTGKELLARAIHQMSGRRDRPLVNVNCAALPAALVDAELFGHEKGAYTGAATRRAGRFEIAHRGTIFLDEIGEMPLEIQAKLLRVLQEGQFERLGSTDTITADVRVIAATNRDLAKAIEAGKFREDLYYRLNVFPIVIPPLRERAEDIPALVRTFVEEFGKKLGKPIEHISRECLENLQRYSWPGNVRELRNVIERAMIGFSDSTLRIEIPTPVTGGAQAQALQVVERQYIVKVLQRTNWRVRGKHGAAEILDLKPSTLESKMAKLGITRPKLLGDKPLWIPGSPL